MGERAGGDKIGVAFEDPNKGLRLQYPALVVKPGPGTGGGPLLEFRGYRF